jgi:hypothetical protein
VLLSRIYDRPVEDFCPGAITRDDLEGRPPRHFIEKYTRLSAREPLLEGVVVAALSSEDESQVRTFRVPACRRVPALNGWTAWQDLMACDVTDEDFMFAVARCRGYKSRRPAVSVTPPAGV